MERPSPNLGILRSSLMRPRSAPFSVMLLCILSNLGLAVGGCESTGDGSRGGKSPAERAPSGVSAAPSASGSALPSLEVGPSVVELQAGQSWVAAPRGAREPRPIVLFWDGSTQDTSAACARLYALAQRVPFILCKRALDGPTNPRPSVELRGALQALKQRFGAHVAGGSLVFVASGVVVPASLSAIREEPAFFSRVLLVSEERIPWSATLSSLFGKAGGQRVLFACLEQRCFEATAHPSTWLERHGAQARALEPPKSPQKNLLPIAAQDFGWLVEGDARFSPGGP